MFVVVQPAVSADICILVWLRVALVLAAKRKVIGITVVVTAIAYSTIMDIVIMIILVRHIQLLLKVAAAHK
jgi:hypothetical protein